MSAMRGRQGPLPPWRKLTLVMFFIDVAWLPASYSVPGSPWNLPSLSLCMSHADPLYPGTGVPSSLSLDKTSDTLWTATTSTIYKHRYSDSKLLLSQDFSGSAKSLGLSISHMPGGKLAVVDGQSQLIHILNAGSVAVDQTIQLDVTPSVITHNPRGGEFYLAAAGEPGVVYRIAESGGVSTVFLGPGSALWGGRPQEIRDLQYAQTFLGSLFLLSSDSGVIMEVNLEGETIADNSVRADSSVQAMALSGSGKDLVLLRQGGILETWCHSGDTPAVSLQPGTYVNDARQVWYGLGSYNSNIPCGAWGDLPAFSPATDLRDVVYSPVTRTFWALDNGSLQERDISTGQVLRAISKQRLAGLGLPSVTSLAGIGARKLLLGIQDGNRLAVLDTGFPEASSAEKAVSDAQEAVIRLGNPATVELSTTVVSPLLKSNSLGAIFYSAEESRVYIAPAGEALAGSAGVIWTDLQAGNSGVALPRAVLSFMGYPQVDSLMYSPRANSFLVWCSACNAGAALLTEVVAGPDGFRMSGSVEPDGELFESYPSTFAITADGGMAIFVAPNGQARSFCSLAASGNTIVPAEGWLDGHVDLEAFLLRQFVADPPAPAAPAEVFSYLFGTSCRSNSMLITDTTMYDCESRCSKWKTCTAYTYNTGIGRCFLKGSCFGYQRGTNAADISALKLSSM